jgi:hypothetical protein
LSAGFPLTGEARGGERVCGEPGGRWAMGDGRWELSSRDSGRRRERRLEAADDSKKQDQSSAHMYPFAPRALCTRMG